MRMGLHQGMRLPLPVQLAMRAAWSMGCEMEGFLRVEAFEE